MTDEGDDITEELTAMLSHLHASNPMSVDKLLNSPEENVLKEHGGGLLSLTTNERLEGYLT
ncbi:hypothetical protein JG687_00014701 [Phytophthora cactorum]|uniref:Uncharacterized protein n=1 Tax=Phytophthora cactorum TaxID=29920 RepID=A0A8T1TWB6_9STRA|nr:hypothetical protein JG687_00014701 [Phytophthora cactorum]